MPTVREPLLILIGAGASVGFAPSSEALTARLKEWDPDNRGRGLFEPYLSVLSQDDTSQANFEDLIALLDELRDRWRSRTTPSHEWALAALEAKRRPAAWPIVHAAIRTYEPPGHRRSANHSFALNWLAHDARAYVLEHIWQSVAAVTGHELREAPINRTIRVLAEHFQCTVASLNYDHVLDYLGIPLDHGFNPFTDQPAPFDPSWELRAVPDDAIRFLPLHGSVHFGFGRKFPGQIRWFPQIEQAADSWSTIQEAFRRQDHHEPLMVAGRDKTRHLLASPYGCLPCCATAFSHDHRQLAHHRVQRRGPAHQHHAARCLGGAHSIPTASVGDHDWSGCGRRLPRHLGYWVAFRLALGGHAGP